MPDGRARFRGQPVHHSWVQSKECLLGLGRAFGSDPRWYVYQLASGSYESRRHPLLHLIVGAPALLVASILHAATGAERAALAETAVMLIPPLTAALKTAMLMLVCRRLGFSLAFSTLIALIDIGSLSRLLFGSIPETYGITAAALMWVFYLTVCTTHGENPPRRRN